MSLRAPGAGSSKRLSVTTGARCWHQGIGEVPEVKRHYRRHVRHIR